MKESVPNGAGHPPQTGACTHPDRARKGDGFNKLSTGPFAMFQVSHVSSLLSTGVPCMSRTLNPLPVASQSRPVVSNVMPLTE